MNNTCNFCGFVGNIIWAEREYSALQCRDCGVIWVFPQPNPGELNNIYSQDYFEKWYLKYEKERKAYFRKQLEEVKKVVAEQCHCEEQSDEAIPLRDCFTSFAMTKKSRVSCPRHHARGRSAVAETRRGGNSTTTKKLLDIGCGVGFFLEVAKEKGWDCEGLEMSEFASQHVRNKGFIVHTGDLTQMDSLSGEYDLITMWDVLAHLSNPMGYLEKIRELLRDNGLLVIKTPDHPHQLFELVKFVSFTGHSRGILHIPAQIYHFEPKNLSELLNRFGFKVVKIKKVKEALKGGWTTSKWRNFLISFFKVSAKIFGVSESFIVYAIKM